MKKKIAFLLFFSLFTGCAYNEYKYGISVPGTEGGRLDLKDAARLKAMVVEQNSGRRVSSQRIKWLFGGVFSAEPGKSGEFQVSKAGQGTIRALLPIGDNLKSVETQITVTGLNPMPSPSGFELSVSPQVEKKLEPSPLPQVVKKIEPSIAVQVVKKLEPSPLPHAEKKFEPSPTPAPLPQPVAESGGEETIMKAYSCAEKGDYREALSLLDSIKEPEWKPKVKALRLEWGSMVVDSVIEQAAKCLIERDLAATLKQLDILKNLPKTPKQQNQERQIRKRIKELL